MTDLEIQRILVADLQNKKTFEVNWNTECDGCGVELSEGDTFIFMGDKEKICNECLRDIISYIEIK